MIESQRPEPEIVLEIRAAVDFLETLRDELLSKEIEYDRLRDNLTNVINNLSNENKALLTDISFPYISTK